MSRFISLSSDTTNANNFTTYFNPPIENGLSHDLCLLNANLWFTSVNLEDKTLLWSSNGGSSYNTISIPTGNYTVSDVDNLLKTAQLNASVTDVDSVTGERIYGIRLVNNYNTNRIDIQIDNTVGSGNTFQVDLTDSANISVFLGFTEKVVTSTESGTLIPQVNGGVNNYQIHCDIVDGSAIDNGISGDVIGAFVPAVPVGANINYIPFHKTFQQIKKDQIQSITIRITDQNNNLIDFNGELVTVNMEMKPRGDPLMLELISLQRETVRLLQRL